MKKKIAYCIFIAAFFAVCIVPSAGMLIFGESEAAANEILAPRPEFYYGDGTFNREITDDLTSYFADRSAFRQEFITAYAKIQAAVFGESSADDVVLGEDGWLFYDKTTDDYLRRDTLSERSIRGIARTLSMMQEYAAQQGTEFIFTVAPNKNSLSPAAEKMPDMGTPLENKKNIEMLEAALEENGVRYADLASVLDTGTEGVSLYHRLDSHWNNMGAAAAHDRLTGLLGVETHLWKSESYEIVKNHRGDLYEMLYPAGKQLDENVEFDRKFGFLYLQNDESIPAVLLRQAEDTAPGLLLWQETRLAEGTDYYSDSRPSSDSIKIETVSDSGSGNLLMFRDSFGNALYPFMADTFSYAAFSRLMPYRMDWLTGGNFDYTIIEIVERNIPDLAVKAPVMPASDVSLNDDLYSRIEEAAESDNAPAKATASPSMDLPGFQIISGTYDPENIDEDTRVFIDTGELIYEAFPVGASARSEGTDACFTAYIPQEVLNETDFSVILCRNGEFIRNSCETIWN